MTDHAPRSHMRPAALPAWEKLQAALTSTVPDCAGDDRYITDPADLPHEDRAVMAAICAACPLLTTCSEYANTEKPAAGWWPDLNLQPTREKAA